MIGKGLYGYNRFLFPRGGIVRGGTGGSGGSGVQQVVCPPAPAQQQPPAVQQVSGGQRPVLPHRLAVDVGGALGDRAARVGQRRRERRGRQRVREAGARHERRGGDLGGEERQRLRGGARGGSAEQDRARLLGRRRRRGAVHERGHLAGQPPLALPLEGRLRVGGGHRPALLHREQRELEQEPLHVRVGHVHPVLEELVGRGAVGGEPHRAVLALAELPAVRAEQQRPGEGVHVLAFCLPDQVHAGQQVAPLVGAADLEFHAV